MDGWVFGWTNEWMNESTFYSICESHIYSICVSICLYHLFLFSAQQQRSKRQSKPINRTLGGFTLINLTPLLLHVTAKHWKMRMNPAISDKQLNRSMPNLPAGACGSAPLSCAAGSETAVTNPRPMEEIWSPLHRLARQKEEAKHYALVSLCVFLLYRSMGFDIHQIQ